MPPTDANRFSHVVKTEDPDQTAPRGTIVAAQTIGIIHGISCINICQVSRKLFELEAAESSVSNERPGKC